MGKPHRSAPALFNSASGRELLDRVSSMNADHESRSSFAAEMLPRRKKLPALSEDPSRGSLPIGSLPIVQSIGSDGMGSLMDPQSEIAEINRRLAHLQIERQQIQDLKAMALAASNLAPPGIPRELTRPGIAGSGVSLPGLTPGVSTTSLGRSASLSALPPPSGLHSRSAAALPRFRNPS